MSSLVGTNIVTDTEDYELNSYKSERKRLKLLFVSFLKKIRDVLINIAENIHLENGEIHSFQPDHKPVKSTRHSNE